jgi:hypothetical protein
MNTSHKPLPNTRTNALTIGWQYLELEHTVKELQTRIDILRRQQKPLMAWLTAYVATKWTGTQTEELLGNQENGLRLFHLLKKKPVQWKDVAAERFTTDELLQRQEAQPTTVTLKLVPRTENP